MLMEKISYLARGADIFVLAGSLPPNVPEDFYARVIREIKGQVITALDAQGPPLRFGLAADPDLVSPNAREAEEIVGYELNDDNDLAGAAETIGGTGRALGDRPPRRRLRRTAARSRRSRAPPDLPGVPAGTRGGQHRRFRRRADRRATWPA